MRGLVLIAMVGASATASASPHVAWQAPPGCPDGNALLAAIANRLATPIDRVDLAADITVEATATGFVAHVHGDEARELASASCAELTEAVAVIVARSATIVAAVAVVEPAPIEIVTVVPPPVVERSPWNLGARVSGLGGLGNLPGVGLAGELSLFVARDHLAVELAGAVWAPGSKSVGTSSSVRVGVEAATLRVGWRDEHLRGWLAGTLSCVHAEGVGLIDPARGTECSSALGLGGAFAQPLAPHVTAVFALEAQLAINGVTIALSDGSSVYRTPDGTLWGSLGLELAWR